jgi:hypothetical protein
LKSQTIFDLKITLFVEGVSCRRPSPELLTASQGCRLDPDKCDGSSETWCPPYFQVPGTSCSCKANECNGYCGQEKTLGMCISTKDPNLVLGNLSMPTVDACKDVTCSGNLKCIMVTGQPICVAMKSNSCKYRCGGVADAIYSCGCNVNCNDDGSCCSDFKSFCRPLQGILTIEGLIQRLWLLWDQEKMKMIYAGGGLVLFSILLLIRHCYRRRKEDE